MLIFQYHFVILALLLCLFLSGIFTHLGYHVVRRGVIFVDLSLAQISALGASFGVLIGFGENYPAQNYIISLGFTLIGSVLFVLFRQKKEKVPIEALIGITYAGAIALSLIVLERSVKGTEEIKEMLAGSILTVSPEEVIFIFMLCLIVGIIQWIYRKQLLMVTKRPEEARNQGLKIWWWDLVFYMTFGFVVTSAVRIMGVLLVFAFLIIPTVAAIVATQGTKKCLIFGWIFSILGCVAGLELSLRLDWSPCPTIVAVFLCLLILTWFAKRVKRSNVQIMS